MRTTLTLHPDVALHIKERLATSSVTLKQVVNDVIRRGIASASPPTLPPFQIRPIHLEFPPGVDPNKLHQWLDDLDTMPYFEEVRRLESQMARSK